MTGPCFRPPCCHASAGTAAQGGVVTTPYLIAGLGNPGAEYVQTRHNAGFRVVEELARQWQVSWTESPRFASKVARATRGERTVWLARPLTYMNVSGEAVGAMTRYYRIPVAATLIVVDDADLPLGTLRMRPDGSSGGHHGLESVESHLGTRGYARLRLGIGRNDEGPSGMREISGHVLGRFSASEQEVFGRVLPQAVAQVTCWLEQGIEKAMARYNGPVK